MSLIIKNLTIVKNDKTLIEDISLLVERGKITTILGANGAGKSEFVLGVAGMLPVSSGSVTVDDQNITNKRPNIIRQAGVAAVPEGHRVLSKLSIDENLRAAASGMPIDSDTALNDVYSIFPELAARKGQIAGTLSGGQQQMVALSHALIAKPKFVLLDEMSLGLAPLVVKRLMVVVKNLATTGVGIILIEQFAEMALDIADSVCVFSAGKMHFTGRASTLRTRSEILKEAYFGQ